MKNLVKEFYEDETIRINRYVAEKMGYQETIPDLTPLDYEDSFDTLGQTIIKKPQDILAIQEIIWQVRPDLIIWACIAHGGSLIFSASMLALMNMCDATEAGEEHDSKTSRSKLLGIDIDIRAHYCAALEAHPMASCIQVIQGSSITPEAIEQMRSVETNYARLLGCLDINHTHYYVQVELQASTPRASKGRYCVVFNTFVEDMPREMMPDYPWGRGENHKTVMWEYLKTKPEFEIDKSIQDKQLITVAQDVYLKRGRLCH